MELLLGQVENKLFQPRPQSSLPPEEVWRQSALAGQSLVAQWSNPGGPTRIMLSANTEVCVVDLVVYAEKNRANLNFYPLNLQQCLIG